MIQNSVLRYDNITDNEKPGIWMSQKFQSGISTPRGFPELLLVFSLRWKTEKVEVVSNMGQRMA